MKPLIALAALVFLPGAAAALTPIADPIALNIGLGCQWQQKCIDGQTRAMRKSLKYVAKYHPPEWRLALCNRNASRGRNRVDWSGFDHCIRNETLRQPPPPPPPRAAARRPPAHRHTKHKRPAH